MTGSKLLGEHIIPLQNKITVPNNKPTNKFRSILRNTANGTKQIPLGHEGYQVKHDEPFTAPRTQDQAHKCTKYRYVMLRVFRKAKHGAEW